MTSKYVVREKWPRCKKWESMAVFATLEAAMDDFNMRVKREPDDGYKIKSSGGTILVQVVEVTVIVQQSI
jgi:prophage tail gpP-like protein